jgi:hypothetical protein
MYMPSAAASSTPALERESLRIGQIAVAHARNSLRETSGGRSKGFEQFCLGDFGDRNCCFSQQSNRQLCQFGPLRVGCQINPL